MNANPLPFHITAPRLYARREATTDATWIQYGPAHPVKRDLVLYEDAEMRIEKARIPWNQAASRARVWVTINCAKFKLIFPSKQIKTKLFNQRGHLSNLLLIISAVGSLTEDI